MSYYFSMIGLISLFCLGLRVITDDGMIGHPIRKLFLKLPEMIGKPLILCVTCMSSFWGTIIYWSNTLAYQNFNYIMISDWLGITISAAFVNAIFWAYYQNINTCK